MPTKSLVELHNNLTFKHNIGIPLKSWKQSKSVLIGRIEDLRTRIYTASEELEVTETQSAAEDPGEASDEAGETSEPRTTIRQLALDLLCTTVFYEDKSLKASEDNVVEIDHPNARSVGIPYLDIIAHIKESFPLAQTSVACLRWYAVKVRAEEFGYEGFRLAQRRPRAKTAK